MKNVTFLFHGEHHKSSSMAVLQIALIHSVMLSQNRTNSTDTGTVLQQVKNARARIVVT